MKKTLAVLAFTLALTSAAEAKVPVYPACPIPGRSYTGCTSSQWNMMSNSDNCEGEILQTEVRSCGALNLTTCYVNTFRITCTEGSGLPTYCLFRDVTCIYP